MKKSLSLSTITHVCLDCGYMAYRSINASINILRLGFSTMRHTETYATGDLPSWAVTSLLSKSKSVNVESSFI
uniref:hypothetical protein n=1 Tax=Calothrix rhizosoleniae TaxID=888997 RepID=UPI002E1402C7